MWRRQRSIHSNVLCVCVQMGSLRVLAITASLFWWMLIHACNHSVVRDKLANEQEAQLENDFLIYAMVTLHDALHAIVISGIYMKQFSLILLPLLRRYYLLCISIWFQEVHASKFKYVYYVKQLQMDVFNTLIVKI